MAPRPSAVLCLCAVLGLAASAGPYSSLPAAGRAPPPPSSGYGAPAHGASYRPPTYGTPQNGNSYGAQSYGSYGAPRPGPAYGAPKPNSGYGAPPYGGYGRPGSSSPVGPSRPHPGVGSPPAARPPPSKPVGRPPQSAPVGNTGGGLYLSWENPQHASGQYTWAQADQQCRQLGLKLVSLTSPDKDREITNRLLSARVEFYWTSGQRRTEAGPFFWQDSTPVCGPGQPGCYQNWGPTGGDGRPQPDNREGSENCMAVLNNFYGDGIVWHDIACHHQKHFVCE